MSPQDSTAWHIRGQSKHQGEHSQPQSPSSSPTNPPPATITTTTYPPTYPPTHTHTFSNPDMPVSTSMPPLLSAASLALPRLSTHTETFPKFRFVPCTTTVCTPQLQTMCQSTHTTTHPPPRRLRPRRPSLAHQQPQQYACTSPLLPTPRSRPQQQQQQCRPGRQQLLPPPSAAAGGAALPAQPAGDPPARVVAPLQPIKLVPAAIAVAFGFFVKFVLPTPGGITPEAWTLFSVFLSTILGLVLQPLPVGAWAFLGLCVVVATKTLPFAKVGEGWEGACVMCEWVCCVGMGGGRCQAGGSSSKSNAEVTSTHVSHGIPSGPSNRSHNLVNT